MRKYSAQTVRSIASCFVTDTCNKCLSRDKTLDVVFYKLYKNTKYNNARRVVGISDQSRFRRSSYQWERKKPSKAVGYIDTSVAIEMRVCLGKLAYSLSL